MDAITKEVSKTDTENLIAELESRTGLYRLFACLFSREIDQQLLDELRKPEFFAAITELGLCLHEPGSDDDLIVEQLAVEFARLFLGPGKHISPHESVHTGQDGVLNDATTVSVSHFIEVAGYVFKADSRQYPDHISSEFEFMEALINKQIEAMNEGELEEAVQGPA